MYYQISIIGSALEPLTYCSDIDIAIGDEVIVPLRTKSVRGVVIEQCEKPEFKTTNISDKTSYYYSSNQLKIATFISQYYMCHLGEAINLFTPYHRDIIDVSSKIDEFNSITLSPIQNEALEFITSHEISLLFGDTGSGKSEIYMKRMESVISSNQRCLLLLPEISLTPQMESRFKAHFGDIVALWHSKMSPKQKQSVLETIYKNESKIIIAARSGLFLPIDDLGLIIVDEEHDDSYKASSNPRYNAKDMAIYTAKALNIPIVLGSATPSPSSYEKYPFFRLKGGYFSSKREFRFIENSDGIDGEIIDALLENYKKSKQSILFIPTRGNFKYTICGDCGYFIECPFCSVGMSQHKNSNALRCHYCNYSEVIPKKCPKCHSSRLDNSRVGTAEAYEQLKNIDDDIVISQFDRDSITTQKKLITILDKFNKKEIDILVGTQMLTKGHNYHDITLAVVIGIDNLLNQSDYRAREKALSQLIQISGRSGRREDATIIIASKHSQFYKQYLDDYELFLRYELAMRADRYPPYKKLARVLYAHTKEYIAKNQMLADVEILKTIPIIEVVGYGANAIEKIANKYRFQILLRADKTTNIIRSIKMLNSKNFQVDIDPIEFS